MIRALLPAFRTRRLLAQRLDRRHLDQLVRFNADPEVMQSLGGVASEEETRAWLAESVEPHWEEHGYGVFALFEKHAPCAEEGEEAGAADMRGAGAAAGRELVGRAGLQRVTIEGTDEVELLYAIAPAYWGQGYTTEIGRLLTGLALGSLDLETVVAFTLPDNAASRCVLEKLDFVCERDIEHAGLPHVLYRVTREGRGRA